MKRDDEQVQNLIEYYFKYSELVTLHRNFGYGKAPRLSEGFTEGLCRSLFSFEKVSGVKREYDLFDRINNKRIEVKATTDDCGSTSINPSAEFDFLYWINFRLDFNVVWVRVIPYEKFKRIHAEKIKAKRMNVQLDQFLDGNEGMKIFKLRSEKSVIREISVEEYLELIRGKVA